jgi:antitoxin PrlF
MSIASIPSAMLTSKGQTTIPKDVRDAIGLKPGDRMYFSVLSNGTVVLRTKNRSVSDLRGILKTKRKLPIEQLSR